MFIELGLLQLDQQHALIKVSEKNTNVHQIHQDLDIGREGEDESEASIFIPLKGNNQGSIALAHYLVFYSKINYINIQYYYIWNEMVA